MVVPNVGCYARVVDSFSLARQLLVFVQEVASPWRSFTHHLAFKYSMAVHHFHRLKLLRSLYYAAAFLIAGFFLLSRIIACCWRSRKSHPPKYLSVYGQRTSLVLVVSLVFLHLIEGVLDLIKQPWYIPPHVVAYLLSSILVWGLEGSQYISRAARLRSVKGSSLLGLVAETAMALLIVSDSDFAGTYAATLGLHLGRATVLFVLLLVSVYSPGRRCLEPDEGDNRRLYDGGSVATNYATISDTNTGLRSQGTKKVSDYMDFFRTFFPILTPRGHRKIQVCYAVLGLQILWTRVENILIPHQLGVVIEKLSESPAMPPWKDILIWMTLLWLSSNAGLNWIRSYARARVHNFSRKRVKITVLEHIMSLSKDFHDKQNVGEVQKAVEQGRGIDMLLEAILFTLAPIILDIIAGLVYITRLFDFYVASIILTTALVYFSLSVWLTKLSISNRREYCERDRQEASVAYESLSLWQMISYFNRIDSQKHWYAMVVDSSVQAACRYWDMINTFHAVLTLITVLGQICAICLAIGRVARGRNNVGDFVTLATYWNQLLKPIKQLPDQYQSMVEQFTDAWRLLELLKTKSPITSNEGAPSLNIIEGNISFKDVSFRYGEKLALQDINFVAKQGQVVAFVGQSGGGKSTILKLLQRYYDVSSGSIKIDGQDIKDVSLDSLRESIGIVPQNPELFNNTILFNLRYVRPEATDEEIFNACKAAAIHEEILNSDSQYETLVGKGGDMLSAGQKQRIAIAQVLLRQSKIVLLDEATSAVDPETEQKVQKALEKLRKGRITFMIAHRLSTIVGADLIAVIHEGKIVEMGTHDDLLNAKGRYAKLWRI